MLRAAVTEFAKSQYAANRDADDFSRLEIDSVGDAFSESDM
jgi:hypothetical protein